MNKEPNVRAETRKRVMAAASDLGYRPNPAARSLAASRSFLIGHLHDNPNNDYVAGANKGIYDAGRSHGYYLLPEPIENGSPALLQRVEEFVITSGVDGLVLTPPLSSNDTLIDFLKAQDMAFVLVSPGEGLHGDTPFVQMDQIDAAQRMTEHLIGLGHERLAFVAGPKSHRAAQGREGGFRNAMKAAKREINEAYLLEAEFSVRAGMRAAEHLLSLPTPPTAIFAANDHMAAGIVTAAYGRGLSIPDDLSVAGFDGSEIGEAMWPPLTTIRNPIEQMANKAAAYLMRSDRDTVEVLQETVSCELIIRDSTGPVPK